MPQFNAMPSRRTLSPSIDYLKENYSIITNEDAYIYHYEVEASNVLCQLYWYLKNGKIVELMKK